MPGIAVRGVGSGLQSLHQNIMNISAGRIPHYFCFRFWNVPKRKRLRISTLNELEN